MAAPGSTPNNRINRSARSQVDRFFFRAVARARLSWAFDAFRGWSGAVSRGGKVEVREAEQIVDP